MLVVSYAKTLHHIFISTIYGTFKSVFHLSRTNENFETCMPVWFEQLNELKTVLRYIHSINSCSKSFTLNSCPFSIFPSLEIKKLIFVGKNILTFRHNVTYMVNSFLVSSEVTLMINILYEIIKILHEKMLNAIYLYWFHDNTSKKNNSLNGHSNEH